jgi:hypothetical protein
MTPFVVQSEQVHLIRRLDADKVHGRLYREIERIGAVTSRPVLGGLHQHISESEFSAHTGH